MRHAAPHFGLQTVIVGVATVYVVPILADIGDESQQAKRVHQRLCIKAEIGEVFRPADRAPRLRKSS